MQIDKIGPFIIASGPDLTTTAPEVGAIISHDRFVH
jgi:hypothetical protein